MQGREENFLTSSDKLIAFLKKLQLGRTELKMANLRCSLGYDKAA